MSWWLEGKREDVEGEWERRVTLTHEHTVKLATGSLVRVNGLEAVHGFLKIEVVAAHEGREELLVRHVNEECSCDLNTHAPGSSFNLRRD